MVEITYDEEAGAWNIKLSDNPIATTLNVADGVNLDFDGDGNGVAIEIYKQNFKMLPEDKN